MKINFFGRFKVWLQRLQTYVSLINFGMLFYVFIVNNSWLPWYIWLVLIVCGLSGLMFFDIKVIMPSGLSYTWIKNPSWHELNDKLDRILEGIK